MISAITIQSNNENCTETNTYYDRYFEIKYSTIKQRKLYEQVFGTIRIYPFKQSTLPCQKKSYLKALRNVREGARFSILPIHFEGRVSFCCHSFYFDLNFKLYPSPFALVQFIHLGERVPLSPSRKSFHRHSTGKGKNPADFPYFFKTYNNRKRKKSRWQDQMQR